MTVFLNLMLRALIQLPSVLLVLSYLILKLKAKLHVLAHPLLFPFTSAGSSTVPLDSLISF